MDKRLFTSPYKSTTVNRLPNNKPNQHVCFTLCILFLYLKVTIIVIITYHIFSNKYQWKYHAVIQSTIWWFSNRHSNGYYCSTRSSSKSTEHCYGNILILMDLVWSNIFMFYFPLRTYVAFTTILFHLCCFIFSFLEAAIIQIFYLSNIDSPTSWLFFICFLYHVYFDGVTGSIYVASALVFFFIKYVIILRLLTTLYLFFFFYCSFPVFTIFHLWSIYYSFQYLLSCSRYLVGHLLKSMIFNN